MNNVKIKIVKSRVDIIKAKQQMYVLIYFQNFEETTKDICHQFRLCKS